MMEPEPRRTIPPTACLVNQKAPRTLVSMMYS